jgi:hypothetical protein
MEPRVSGPGEGRGVTGTGLPRQHDWGERLSDRIRRALEAGDLDGAGRLAAEGDGLARSLGKEYALMYKGLGVTLRVMLGLMDEAAGRPRAREAGRALAAVLARFHRDWLALLAGAYGEAAASVLASLRDAPPADATDHVAATLRFLAAAEGLFDREQARVAGEVAAAIAARDGARARAALDRKERGQYAPLHDRLVRLMAEIFGLVLERGGPEALARFHRATAEGQRRGFEAWERMEAGEFARATALLLRQHMGVVQVREDDDRYTIVQTPCGSGGRLRLEGAYRGPAALPFVDGPGPLTHGQARFAVYCTHCPIWNGVAPLEWFGRPHWVFEDPSRADGSCTLHIMKRRDGAGPGYAALLGVRG